MNKYGKKELDLILTELQNDLRLAISIDEKTEIKTEIQYFKKELQLLGA